MNLYRKAQQRIEDRFADQDLLSKKKALLLFFWSIILLLLMGLLTLGSVFISFERFVQFTPFTGTISLGSVLCILCVLQGRLNTAALSALISYSLVVGIGLALKYALAPHASFALAYFSAPIIVLGALFTTRIVVSLLALYFVTCQSVLFALLNGRYENLLSDSIKNAFLDSVAATVITYLISLMIIQTMTGVIRLMREENTRNKKQLGYISSLLQTIRNTSDTLQDSLSVTNGAIQSISTNSQSQASSMEELSATIEEISAGSINAADASCVQNDSLNHLIEIIRELSESIKTMDQYGTTISALFGEFSTLVSEGERSSTTLDETNRKLLENSENILSIATIMNEFFDRINLLALNASIEAARAGDQGRGFAVVADEISKLADSSAGELKQITDLITKNKQDAESGNRIIGEIVRFLKLLTGKSETMQGHSHGILDEINRQKSLRDTMDRSVSEVSEKTGLITNLMKEQQISIGEVARSIENTNEVVQNNSLSIERLRDNSRGILTISESLMTELKSGAHSDN